jgi:hypothetical protein
VGGSPLIHRAAERVGLLGNCSRGPECNAFGFLAVCLTKVCLTKNEEDTNITREEIERGFVDAGWEVPGSSQYPIVGNAEDLSIVAHEQYAETDDPAFELVDRRRVVGYWVRVIPTPRQAAVLLEEHGGLP